MALATDPGDPLRVSATDPARHRAALDDGRIGVHVAADGAVIYQRLRGSSARRSAAGASAQRAG
jgi:hypothetical protein